MRPDGIRRGPCFFAISSKDNVYIVNESVTVTIIKAQIRFAGYICDSLLKKAIRICVWSVVHSTIPAIEFHIAAGCIRPIYVTCQF